MSCETWSVHVWIGGADRLIGVSVCVCVCVLGEGSERIIHEPGNSISYKIACAPNEDSDQTESDQSLCSALSG